MYCFRLACICITAAIAISSARSVYWKVIEILRFTMTGLVYTEFIDGRNWVSWLILASTPIYVWFSPIETKERISRIVFGLFCPLSLLSASYEPFFFLTIALHLLSWPHSDTPTIQRNEGPLSTKELSRAAIFMLYTLLCFFGTGNMASISSFDPSWTRHFITIFSPFVMTSLILLKLSIPLLLIGCTCHNLGHPTIFLAVLLLGDCLALPLMYSVTPHGSWLDIGSAISRFTIAISLPCLLVILHYIAQPFLKFSIETLAPRVVLKKEHFVWRQSVAVQI